MVGVTPKNKNTGVVVREGEERREKGRGLDGRRGFVGMEVKKRRQ